MADGTLYTYPENTRAYKVLIAAKYSGTNVKVASQPPEFVFGETNKSESFLAKFPHGKIPTYEAKNGVCLFESNAISYYVSNDALRGSNPTDAAFVQQWINFADSEILPAACTWVFPCIGIMQYNKQNTERAKTELARALSTLNKHLLTRTYLVGERVSLADITVATNLLLPFKWVLDAEFRQPYQNVTRWFTTLINQPQFKEVIGEVNLCEKAAQFDAKKFQEMQAALKGGDSSKPQTKKEGKKEKPKQETPKKPEGPPEAEDADDDGVPREKSKDPFAHLPAGKFNMEEWKREYSNKDTLTVALPYFWSNFEKENYSLWFCEYKFPEELKMVFMSCNLISGMFQRLDKMRKHAFGSCILFGENNNSTISGIWCWRGQDLAFELSPDLQVDYNSYTWTKLNPDDEKTKKLVNEYFAWAGDFDGKKFNQGKIFK